MKPRSLLSAFLAIESRRFSAVGGDSHTHFRARKEKRYFFAAGKARGKMCFGKLGRYVREKEHARVFKELSATRSVAPVPNFL